MLIPTWPLNVCRLSIACLLAAGLLAEIALADDGDVAPQRVSALLKQLDANSRQERQSAEKELLELGPAILDALPPPDLLPNVAVREAVRRLRIQLERAAAEQSIRASRVTLTGEYGVRDLVAAISEQTGNNVVCAATLPDSVGTATDSDNSTTPSDSRPASSGNDTTAANDVFDQKLAIDWSDEPFWNAIGQIEAAGLRARFPANGSSLVLTPVAATANPPTGPRHIQQAFRIDALNVERREIAGTDNVLVRVPLRILCEPRLRPLFLRCSMSDWSLSTGVQNVNPFSPGSRVEIPLGDGGREAKLELSFLANSAAARRENLTLAGRLTLLTAALEREITFPKLGEAEGLTRRRGGVTVTVNQAQIRSSDDRSFSARVRTQIGYDSRAQAFESHQTWIFHNQVFLRDPDGNKYAANDGFSTLFQGDGSVGVEYRFSHLPNKPAEWQFTYVAPTLLIDVPLDVRIDGIPAVPSTGR